MKKGENPLALRKTQGSVAELFVAQHVMGLGWRILFPFGENCRYDLVAEKNGSFVRVQVKYTTPKNGALMVRCRSSNNWSVKSYTSEDVDCIASFDPVNLRVYFLPISCANNTCVSLRLHPSKNRQEKRIQHAASFVNFPF
jgi:Holliday junction resolvase-like predicted endonuclease